MFSIDEFIIAVFCCVEEGIDLQTQLRTSMKETRPTWWFKWIKRIRRLVETVIVQLTERVQIERVWARDL